MNLDRFKVITIIFALAISFLFIEQSYADVGTCIRVTVTEKPTSDGQRSSSQPATKPAPVPNSGSTASQSSRQDRTPGGGVVIYMQATVKQEVRPAVPSRQDVGISVETREIPKIQSKNTQDRTAGTALSSLPQVTYNDLLSDERPSPKENPQVLKVDGKPIVVVAFPDRAQQEGTLGRIAYYTERNKGSIVSQEELRAYYAQGHSPFTAHDFHTQGLAGFYNAFARAQGESPQLRLTSGETWFRDELLRLGILRLDGDNYSAAMSPFAVISYTGEYANRPEAMKLIIEHEYNHAIFYTNPIYREKVTAVWNDLSQLGRGEIESYLSKTYDISDSTVKLKEFAAYFRDFDRLVSLGQPIRDLRSSTEWEAISGAIGQLRALDAYYDKQAGTILTPFLEKQYILNPNSGPGYNPNMNRIDPNNNLWKMPYNDYLIKPKVD